MIRRPSKIRPYATKGELTDYLDYHKEMLLARIRGLVGIEVKEDSEGPYFELRVRESEDDFRAMTLEEAIPRFAWQNPRPVRARVVVVHA